MKPVDGSRDDEELLEKGEAGPPSDWSRDGRYILRARQRGPGNDDIWALPLDGNRKAFQVVESPFNEGNGQFSPDGKWIAFQSDESGQMEIYVQPFPGPARKTVITNGGGAQARWREDGRELFYLTHDARLMVVPTRTDSNPPVVGKPTLLFRTHPAFNAAAIGVRSYAVSPDGQRFLVDTLKETTIPITVLLNWKPKP